MCFIYICIFCQQWLAITEVLYLVTAPLNSFYCALHQHGNLCVNCYCG